MNTWDKAIMEFNFKREHDKLKCGETPAIDIMATRHFDAVFCVYEGYLFTEYLFKYDKKTYTSETARKIIKLLK